jgi:hypothetical protein
MEYTLAALQIESIGAGSAKPRTVTKRLRV